MERGLPSMPDWRDGAAYALLRRADRTILAWEWLRRDPGYRAASAISGADHAAARPWGLHRFENPLLGAPLARPMWSNELYDAVLGMLPDPGTTLSADLIGLGPLVTRCETTRMRGGSGTSLLISDGWRSIRMDLAPGTAWPGCVAVRFLVAGPPRLAAQLQALRRLESLLRTGRFGAVLHRPETRACRHVLLLRTADALAAGASQREIVECLIDPAARGANWRHERPELRLRGQRLVRDARAYARGRWRRLLSNGGACR
jgi:hypothetical protein